MTRFSFLSALVIAATSTAALAQDGPTAEQKARQGMMRIMALNMGVLGGMAKGEMPFDAAKAQGSADTLVAVSGIHQGNLWPQGSGMDDSMTSEALGTIWEKPQEFASDWSAFGEAASGLQAAVAGGQAALGPAMGKAGKACSGCHETFRKKQE
ncbi:MAG: cytochrome c [Rhodobacteraceae bacterium]|nr:cytochrome c [Paracoccaceae bacterium]